MCLAPGTGVFKTGAKIRRGLCRDLARRDVWLSPRRGLADDAHAAVGLWLEPSRGAPDFAQMRLRGEGKKGKVKAVFCAPRAPRWAVATVRLGRHAGVRHPAFDFGGQS